MSKIALKGFLPMSVDVAQVGRWPPVGTTPTLEHLVQTARAAHDAGVEGLLVPTSYLNVLDNVSTAAAVLAATPDIYLLLAVRPNQYHPAHFAKVVASLTYLFPGRIRLNVLTGGWDEDGWVSDFENRQERQERLIEWLEVLNAMLGGPYPAHAPGPRYPVRAAQMHTPGAAPVPIALSGSSPKAREALARFGSEYIMYVGRREDVRGELERLWSTPGLDAGLEVTARAHIVVRATEDEAWAAARHLVAAIDPAVTATIQAQRNDAKSQRAAQNRLAAGDDLVIGPNLWAGVGQGIYGAAVAIVGAPEQIADRLAEYLADGVTGFILSGYPKLGEYQRMAGLLTPVLRQRGLL